MIIFGSGMYFKTNKVKSFGSCPHCGRFGKMTSYRSRRFGHLYFIPLLPLGGGVQVLRECKSCRNGAHIDRSQAKALTESLADRFKQLSMALAEGEVEIETEPGQPPINTAARLAGSLEDLYCLGEIDSADAVVDLMDAGGLQMERELVLGVWNQLHGHLEQAESHFELAHRIAPRSPYPLYQLGMLHIYRNNAEAAESTFGKYRQLCPDDLSPITELAGLFEQQKNWPKIVEYYDKIYAIHKQSWHNKAMAKLYKKACKKSGVEGKFLNQI